MKCITFICENEVPEMARCQSCASSALDLIAHLVNGRLGYWPTSVLNELVSLGESITDIQDRVFGESETLPDGESETLPDPETIPEKISDGLLEMFKDDPLLGPIIREMPAENFLQMQADFREIFNSELG